jgi:hypothetical protein
MAIFANGTATQTSSVGTAAGTVPIFTTSGLTGTLRNVAVSNTGTATCYVGGGTAVTVAAMPVAPGGVLVLQGSAVTLYALTSAGTTTTVAGLASQLVVD